MKTEFNLKPHQIEKLKKNTDKYKRDDLEITDSNFLKLVDEKVVYYKENYFNKKGQENLEKKNAGKNIDKEKNQLESHNKNVPNSDKNPKDDEKNKKKRRFEILKHNLIYLRDNNVTPREYLNNNPFNNKPFQIKESIDFFDCVKYDKLEEMENMLNTKDLLFCYDYFHQTPFHWAAKRNKLRTARIMLLYGKCINLLDSNNMTPLHFAAQNNNYDMVQLLCENGANPFIKNIDGKKRLYVCFSTFAVDEDYRFYIFPAVKELCTTADVITDFTPRESMRRLFVERFHFQYLNDKRIFMLPVPSLSNRVKLRFIDKAEDISDPQQRKVFLDHNGYNVKFCTFERDGEKGGMFYCAKWYMKWKKRIPCGRRIDVLKVYNSALLSRNLREIAWKLQMHEGVITFFVCR